MRVVHTINIHASAVIAAVLAFVGCYALFAALPTLYASVGALLFLGLLWTIMNGLPRRDMPQPGQSMTEAEIIAANPQVAARLPAGYKIASILESGLGATPTLRSRVTRLCCCSTRPQTGRLAALATLWRMPWMILNAVMRRNNPSLRSAHRERQDACRNALGLCQKLNHLHEASVINLTPNESFALGAATGLAEKVVALEAEIKDLEHQIDNLNPESAMR